MKLRMEREDSVLLFLVFTVLLWLYKYVRVRINETDRKVVQEKVKVDSGVYSFVLVRTKSIRQKAVKSIFQENPGYKKENQATE